MIYFIEKNLLELIVNIVKYEQVSDYVEKLDKNEFQSFVVIYD